MVRIINIILLVALVILGIIAYVYYNTAVKNKAMYEEQVKFDQTKAIRDSIAYRQLIRAKDDEAFKYRDSLRQVRINNTKLKNEKARLEKLKAIKSIANADDNTLDSIWTGAWAINDSLPY
jgi:hypothetical protein